MTIEAAILNLQAKLLALPGMKAAPNDPPEAIGAYPFAISYEYTGETEPKSASFADDLAIIRSEIHVNREQGLPKAIQQAMTFRDPFLKALIADPTLGGTVSTVRSPIRRLFTAMLYNDTQTFGYRFEITVKVQLSV